MATTPDITATDEAREIAPAFSTLAEQTRGEIDVQIATARRFPRSIRRFVDRVLEMATLTEEVAETCIYALPRDGKTVEGPSARFAEICASAWGHLRIEGRVVGEDERAIIGRGTAWDLESNTAIAYESARRIVDKNGKRYKDDMVIMTGNAATSIALRNAVLKVIPSPYWRPAYNKAREVAVGNAETLADRRAKMLAYFQKMGVPEARVLAQLEVKGIEDVTLDHLVLLKGIATAIKEGDTSVDDAFPVQVIQPRRASAAEAPAGAQDASATSVPNAGDLGTSTSAAAPSASPTTPPPRETRNLRITNTSFVKPKKGEPYYEVEATAASGDKLKFRTTSEPLYKEAASFEGTDHAVAVQWHSAKVGDKVVPVLLSLALDEGGDGRTLFK